MKTLDTRAWLAGFVSVAALVLMSFTPRLGGYSYTIHLNNKQVSEHYLTSKFETPTLSLTNNDLKGTLTIYFNECGEIGKGRKLSLRDANQKTLKEWSYANSITKHDPMDVSLSDISSLLASGKVAIYYSSERVTKPQVIANLATSVNANKLKATSR